MLDTLSRWSGRWLHTPWAAILPMLLLLPFLLSGGFRSVTGTSLGIGLVFWLVLTAGVVLLARRFGLPRLTGTADPQSLAAPLALVGALALVAWTYRLWWTTPFGGLPNTFQGVDIGNHVKLFKLFVHVDHTQYEGFVGLYALMHWYWQVLFAAGLSATKSTYYAMRFAHYATLLAVPVALALVVYPSLARLERRQTQLVAAALSLPMQMAVLAALTFPVLQYYQAEGFFSQTVGVYPIVLGWIFYGLTEDVRARFILAMFWLVVQRFTYGLNLGDTLITCAYLFSWEAHAMKPAWLRWGARLFVPVACVVAYLVYSKLYPLRVMAGYFIKHSVAWVVPSQILLSVVLLSARAVLERAGVVVTDASHRLWRYAGTLGLVNGVITAVYFMYDEPMMYYVMKYSLYAFVLVSLASAGPLAAVIAHLVERAWSWSSWREQLRLLVAVSITSVLVLGGYSYGYACYRPLARERFKRTAENLEMFSNFEPRVDDFIERTLRAQNKPFGGYYDPFWPRMFLTNALRDELTQIPDYHYNGWFNQSAAMFIEYPGRCYFTVGTQAAYHGVDGTPLRRQVTMLRDRADQCIDFKPAWGTATLNVCATCL